MTDVHRLANAAYHSERVASRKLAARLHIPEAQALEQVLTVQAGSKGLEFLLAGREALLAADQARRAQRDAVRLAAQAARQARQRPDPACWNAWFDGSARPNPGPCAIGALIVGPGGETIEISKAVDHGSSSEAEYRALIAVLQAAHASGIRALTVYGDSRVVIDDLASAGSDAAPSLDAFRAEARRLAQSIGAVKVQWIPRHRNQRADLLARQGHRQ